MAALLDMGDFLTQKKMSPEEQLLVDIQEILKGPENTEEDIDETISNLIERWDEEYKGIQRIRIDRLLEENAMIQQLVKLQLEKSVQSLVDVVLSSSRSKMKDDAWTLLFQQLGGAMLMKVFRLSAESRRLKQIIKRHCSHPWNLLIKFIEVIKEVPVAKRCQRVEVFRTLDESIAEIANLQKNSTTLFQDIQHILVMLEGLHSKWNAKKQKDEGKDEQTIEHQEEQKEEEKEKKEGKEENNYSKRVMDDCTKFCCLPEVFQQRCRVKTVCTDTNQHAQSLTIDCLAGQKSMLKQLVNLQLEKSVGTLVDVLLSTKRKSEEKHEDWATLFKQLGDDMLMNVFILNSWRLEQIMKRHCHHSSKLMLVFVDVIKTEPKYVGSLVDVLLSTKRISEEEHEVWATLFKQLEGDKLMKVFILKSWRLKQIMKRHCHHSSKLMLVFIDVIKTVPVAKGSEPVEIQDMMQTFDKSIAEIVSLEKNSPTLLQNIKTIIGMLDGLHSKWSAEKKDDHQADEAVEVDIDSKRFHSHNLAFLLGENGIIKLLVKLQLKKSVQALVDVLLCAENKRKPTFVEWDKLFKQLGGDMLMKVFSLQVGSRLLKQIIKRNRQDDLIKLMLGFIDVINKVPVTKEDKLFRQTMWTLDESIAEIVNIMKSSSTLWKDLKQILGKLDEFQSKWKPTEQSDEEAQHQIKEEEYVDNKSKSSNIDILLGNGMIKQLVKLQLEESIQACVDFIFGGIIKGKEHCDRWDELFKQLEGEMLTKVFTLPNRRWRLKKIIKDNSNCASKLLLDFIDVIKTVPIAKGIKRDETFRCMKRTLDESIAEIIMGSSTLWNDLKQILGKLDGLLNTWKADREENQENENQKDENQEQEEKVDHVSKRWETLKIACIKGEKAKICIDQLVNLQLTVSYGASLDYLLYTNELKDGDLDNLLQQLLLLDNDMLVKVSNLSSGGTMFMNIIKKKLWPNPNHLFDLIMEKSIRKYPLFDARVDARVEPLSRGKTVFQELATNHQHDSLCEHDLFRRITRIKWKQYRKYCFISFALYVFMTISLIYTLVTSVMAVNVFTYESQLDRSRLVFEIISAMSVFGCLLIELSQIYRIRWDYFTDLDNVLELSSSLLLSVSIPLRFTAEHVHWYFFAFGYLIWTSQWRKQSIVFKKFYIQAETFIQVLKHDVPWFSFLFWVFNIAFAGAMYLTLKGDNNLYVNNQTSTFPEFVFMGVRTLAEGQPVLEYYGNEEYRIKSIIVLVVFLFAMCVILLNLLIAQISNTLDNQSEEMETNYERRLAFSLAWMEILLPTIFVKTTHHSETDSKQLGFRSNADWNSYLFDRSVSANKTIHRKTEKMKQHLTEISKELNDLGLEDNGQFTSKRKLVSSSGRMIPEEGKQVQQDSGPDTIGKDEVDRRLEWKSIMLEMYCGDIPEKQILRYLDQLKREGHNPVTWKVQDVCPLVLSSEKGNFKLLRRLLSLLEQLESDERATRKKQSMRQALMWRNTQLAAELAKHLNTTELQRISELFMSEGEKIPLIGIFEHSFKDIWLTLLNAMLKKSSITLLDENDYGQKATETQSSNFHKLADWGNLDVFSHAVVRSCIEHKWEECGRKKQFICDMLIYLFTLVCLTVVVVLSGQAEDVNSYQTEADQARLCFEIVSAFLLSYALVKEALELKRTIEQEDTDQDYVDVKGQTETRTNQSVKFGNRIRLYFKDNFNKAECLALLLLLPINIIARLSDTDAFWNIFAFGYFVWVLVSFKYFSIHRELSTYAQSLWIIMTTDVYNFTILFAVVNLAFSGFCLLILKGDNTLHVHNETSTFWGILFVGVRVLTDGQMSLNYYDADGGPGGFSTFMSVATMVVFLFAVTVMLANILIAQLSRTYNIVQNVARDAASVRKARDIAKLERLEWPYCFGPLKSKPKKDVKFESTADAKKNITTKIDNNVETLIQTLNDIKTRVTKHKLQKRLQELKTRKRNSI